MGRHSFHKFTLERVLCLFLSAAKFLEAKSNDHPLLRWISIGKKHSHCCHVSFIEPWLVELFERKKYRKKYRYLSWNNLWSKKGSRSVAARFKYFLVYGMDLECVTSLSGSRRPNEWCTSKCFVNYNIIQKQQRKGKYPLLSAFYMGHWARCLTSMTLF